MVRTYARLEGGDLNDIPKEIMAAGAVAVTAAIGAATDTLKEAYRADVSSASLGERLGKAIGSRLYPRSGASLAAAGIVFPRGTKAKHIIQAWNDGATISAKGGRKWLAISTPKAGHGYRGASITPQKFVEATGIALRFVSIRGKANVALLVGRAGSLRRGKRAKEEIFFVLIRQTTVPSRLHFEGLAESVLSQLPGLIDREWKD